MEAGNSGGGSNALRGLKDAAALEGPLDRELLRAQMFGGTVAPPRIAERYVLEERLGSGGMGVVYAARDEVLLRRVAIKVLRPELAGHAQGRARLIREARALANLSHPNVVTLYDVGEWQDTVYLAMELLEGLSLADWLAGESRSCRAVVELYLQAAAGLAAAHARGLVHRDFKPQNVWVDQEQRVRVLDFGLARHRNEDPVARSGVRERDAPLPVAAQALGGCPGTRGAALLTESNQILGTPAYMSPEQLQGFEVDERSDQYSFCVAVFEATQGHHPNRAQSGALPRRDRLARALLPVLRRGLSPAPDERFTTMGDLVQALSVGLRRRSRWIRGGLLAGGAAMTLATVVTGYQSRELSVLVEDSAATARDRARLSSATRPDCNATQALALLRDVEHPERLAGFRSAAWQALHQPYARSVVTLGERFVDPRATAIAASGACAAVASPKATLVWFEARPSAAERLAFGAEGLLLSSDCSWLAAQLEPRHWRVLRLSASLDDQRQEPLTSFELTASDLHFSLDARWIATTQDDAFEVRALSAGPVLSRLEHAREGRWASQWSPDGRYYLGFEPARGTLLRWPVQPGMPASKPDVLCDEPAWGGIHDLAQSADGRWIAGAFGDGQVRLWPSAGNCGQARPVQHHRRRITAIAFDPRGRWLASGGRDDIVGVWSMETQTERTFPGHGEAINALAFTADGRFVVSASADGTARAWPLDAAHAPLVMRGHQRDVQRISSSAQGAVTVGSDGSIRLWHLPNSDPQVSWVHEAAIWTAVFDPSRRHLATSSDDGTVGLVDLETGRRRLLVGHQGPVRELAFAPAGDRLVSASSDGSALLWDVATGSEWARIEGKGPLYAAAYSPTGHDVAIGGLEHKAWLWNLDRGTAFELAHDATRIVAVQFDPTGRSLYTSDGRYTAIWDVATGMRRGRLEGHVDSALEARFDPLRPRVFIASDDGTMGVFSVDDGRWLGSLEGHDNRTLGAVFSRDGQLLAVPSLDGTLSVWDASHLSLRTTLRRHHDWIAAADFDASGRRVVTASHDGTAHLWWLDDPGEHLVLRDHEGAVRFAGFDARDRVVTAGADGTVRVWSLPSDLDREQIQTRLLGASSYCLSASERIDLLAEDRSAAEMHADACRAASP